MASTTITLFENKSSKQAVDYSFGMTLTDVGIAIDNALPARARITGLELQLSCQASVSVGYANVDTYVSLTNSDSDANDSSDAKILISKSYKSTAGTQTGTADIKSYFFTMEPYYPQAVGYTRLSVYFDTTNITNKTFTCNYLKIKITYDKYYLTSFYNYDGSLIRGHETKEGTMAAYSGTPTRPSDDTYDYEFAGWNPPLALTYADTSYTAVYTAISRKINKIRIDTSPSARVLTDKEDVGIIVDKTKVYG